MSFQGRTISPEIILRALVVVEANPELSMRSLGARFGVSEGTIARWRRKYEVVDGELVDRELWVAGDGGESEIGGS